MTSHSDSDCNDNERWLRRVAAFCEAIDRKPPRKFRNARINWGRGRLTPYSSAPSFIAQFCEFNDLTHKELERFFGGYFGDDENIYIFAKHLPALANLLDEPLTVVNTLSNSSFALPACFGAFESNFSEVKNRERVSYCPACLESGYHAIFHEEPWLYRCPLHREPIERLAFVGGHDGYLTTVKNLLKLNCPRWPDVCLGNAFPGDKFPDFLLLLRWISNAKKRTAKLHGYNAASLEELPYSLENIDILLGRLDAISPISRELTDLMIVPPRRQHQKKEAVTRDAVIKIQGAAKKIPLCRLLWYLRKHNAIIQSRESPSRLIAATEVTKLQQKHSACKCQWAWSRYDGWQRIHSDEERSDLRLCPYEYAIDELRANWLDFVSPNASSRVVLNTEGEFFDACYQVREAKLSTVEWSEPSQYENSGHAGMPIIPLVKNVESLLDVLLTAQVTAHCDELNAWLSSISGGDIPLRRRFAGSVNLFLDNKTAWVSSWTCLEAKSFDAVARREEGYVEATTPMP